MPNAWRRGGPPWPRSMTERTADRMLGAFGPGVAVTRVVWVDRPADPDSRSGHTLPVPPAGSAFAGDRLFRRQTVVLTSPPGAGRVIQPLARQWGCPGGGEPSGREPSRSGGRRAAAGNA